MMGNILKGLKELLNQGENIVDALTNNQVLTNQKFLFDVGDDIILKTDSFNDDVSTTGNFGNLNFSPNLNKIGSSLRGGTTKQS